MQFIYVKISSSDWRERSHPGSTAHVLVHRVTWIVLRGFTLLRKTGNAPDFVIIIIIIIFITNIACFL